MADFTVGLEWLSWHLTVQRSLTSSFNQDTAEIASGFVECDFGFWCLGHNFDVVACILSMSKLSWEKGFDAGLVIADFSNKNPSASPVRLGEDSTD